MKNIMYKEIKEFKMILYIKLLKNELINEFIHFFFFKAIL